MTVTFDDPLSVLEAYRAAVAPDPRAGVPEQRDPGAGREVVQVRMIAEDHVEVYERVGRGPTRREFAVELVRRPQGWALEGEPRPAVPDDVVVDILVPDLPPERARPDPARYAADHEEIYGAAGLAEWAGRSELVVVTPRWPVDVHIGPAGPVEAVPQYDDDGYAGAVPHGEQPDPACGDRHRAVADRLRRAATGIRVSSPLPEDHWQRLDLLYAVANTAELLALQFPGAVLVPGGGCRQLDGAEFEALNVRANEDGLSAVARLWFGVHRVHDHLVGHGLRYLMLPELEGRVPAGAEDRPRARELASLAVALVERGDGPATEIGDTVAHDGVARFRVAPGRVGPAEGESYGRWGSVELVPVEEPLSPAAPGAPRS